MMKKFAALLVACILAGTIAQGQHYKVSLSAGTALDSRCEFITGADFAMTFDVGKKFRIGGGTGFHYYKPAWSKLGEDYRYANEFSIPLYAEVRYTLSQSAYQSNAGKCTPFLSADLGYNIPVSSKVDSKWDSTGNPDINSSFNSFFIEPQIGISIGSNFFMSLGVCLQHCKWIDVLDYTEPPYGDLVPYRPTKRGMTPMLIFHAGINL